MHPVGGRGTGQSYLGTKIMHIIAHRPRLFVTSPKNLPIALHQLTAKRIRSG